MNRVNELVICKDNFDSEKEFKRAINDAIGVLLENNYIMTVRYDEKGLGIVTIDYVQNDLSLGGVFPTWLTPEQRDFLIWQERGEE